MSNRRSEKPKGEATMQAASDEIGRIKITLVINDEAPVEDEIDLMSEEDPILVAQRLVARLFRRWDAGVRRRS